MTPEQVKELIENAGYEARSYSGRGMYGKACIGLTTEDDAFEVAANLMVAYESVVDDVSLETLADVIKQFASDNMGRDSMIYYLPDVEWVE